MIKHSPGTAGAKPGRQPLALVTSATIAGVIGGVKSGIEQLDAVVTNLASSNKRQWDLEDASRSGSDSAVAEAKRMIDAHNAYRTRCIADLDELFSILILDPTATPVTESPGSVIDRLTVLSIRVKVLEERNPDAAFPGQLATVRAQHDQLLLAFDALLHDLKAGARSYVSLPTVKVYKGAGGESS